jgi:RNA polymerase sigma factor (sigma-70 family)
VTTTAETAATRPQPILPEGSRPERAAAARLAELFADHSRAVLGQCRALLRDPDDAEDAAQETFLSAYKSLLLGTVVRDPAAWLATIARNECRSLARKRMREPLAEPPVEAVDAHVEAVRAEDVAALRRALASLPRRQREAFFLREFSGLSYEELAVALGVSGPAVEALLVRARRGLRSALSPVRAAILVPGAAIRELALRLGNLGDSPLPGAAKIASASVGIAVITAGGATVLAHHHPNLPLSPPKAHAAIAKPHLHATVQPPPPPVETSPTPVSRPAPQPAPPPPAAPVAPPPASPPPAPEPVQHEAEPVQKEPQQTEARDTHDSSGTTTDSSDGTDTTDSGGSGDSGDGGTSGGGD